VRILLAADFASIHSRRYVDFIKAAGCEVALLSTGAEISESTGLDCARWPKAGRGVLDRALGERLGRQLSDRIVQAQLRQMWTRSRADICHVQWVGTQARQIAASGISPLVITAWGSDLNAIPPGAAGDEERRWKGEIIAAADMLIADSRDMIATAERLAGRPVRSCLLPLGIDTGLFRPIAREAVLPLRRNLAIPDDAAVILSPRIFRRNYRHDVILRGFAAARELSGREVYLLFKLFDFTEEAYLRDVKEMAEALGIADRVRFMDTVPYDQLPALYAMCDLAISLPEADAFPVTFLECWACEVPILTRRLPAYEDPDTRAFVTFANCSDDAALGRDIARMLARAGTGAPALAAARQHVLSYYTVEATGRRLRDAYQDVLAARSQRRAYAVATG
jgi:glycosyltransferase involved in cell wall biosynthesis